MFPALVRKSRKVLGVVKARLAPTVAEGKARQELACLILDPQVQVMKNSPTAQSVVGTIITAAILTGHWGTATVVTGCWLGSKPLTRVVAGGVAGVGMLDVRLRVALDHLQAMQAELA